MLRNLFPDILWPIAELCPPLNYEPHLDHNHHQFSTVWNFMDLAVLASSAWLMSCKTAKLKQSESPILGRLGNVGLKLI